ncbi:sensor domain-containing diguanylate cyclase [Alkalihalobacterium chitinilyticum]|uniref:Sensor domain-containing diguanylate cyclase n=1 Tax=Alkalihalobacterium chitinilyticum TaxID=2980103 RepID=A0ABT5VI71_9BACI|nr:sensor domain-containing diguanylate cyclase [Alkalihalobacterium chitinilyticum]MDE5415150.1 sensor domain-containing diguanylate cyclase [Alkalihalobacterium chitinilyticum]
MKTLFKRKLKLTTLLIGLITTSVLLTTVILLFASYQSEKRSLIDTHLSLNYSKSEKISSSVDSLFKSMKISLQEISYFLSNNPQMTDEEIQDYLELLKKSSRYFNSLAWIDETGVIQNIAPITVGLKGEAVTGMTKDVVDAKVRMLTPPYIAPSGRMLVLLSEPLFDSEGNYKGIIGGSIYLQEENVLNEILGNDNIESNGSYYFVVGPQGKILFHPDMNRIGDEVRGNTVVSKLLQGESGKEYVVNTKGVPMYAAYNYIPEISWGVVQQTPVSSVNELQKNHIQNLILTILVPFILILLISLTFARKLAKPFIELADLVNQLGTEREVRVTIPKSHWNREADLLTQSVKIAIETVQQNNQKLVEEAMTDTLTELPNRRKFNEVMTRLVNDGQLFSLVILDIDHFKSINDTYGHLQGDEVLKDLTEMVQSLIRKQDHFFRFGGEEFILLLPDTTSKEAFIVAEKIRARLENTTTTVGTSITISLGISEFPFHTHSLDELFLFADKAMYQSKSSGRNRTTIWSPNDRIA